MLGGGRRRLHDEEEEEEEEAPVVHVEGGRATSPPSPPLLPLPHRRYPSCGSDTPVTAASSGEVESPPKGAVRAGAVVEGLLGGGGAKRYDESEALAEASEASEASEAEAIVEVAGSRHMYADDTHADESPPEPPARNLKKKNTGEDDDEHDDSEADSGLRFTMGALGLDDEDDDDDDDDDDRDEEGLAGSRLGRYSYAAEPEHSAAGNIWADARPGSASSGVYPVQQQKLEDQLRGTPSQESHESGGGSRSSGGECRSTRAASLGGASAGTHHSAGPSLHLTAAAGGAGHAGRGVNINNVTTSSSSTVTAGNVTLPSAAAQHRPTARSSPPPTTTTTTTALQDGDSGGAGAGAGAGAPTANLTVGGFAPPPGFLSPISTDPRALGTGASASTSTSASTGGGAASSLQRAAAAASSSRYGRGDPSAGPSSRALPQSQRYGGGVSGGSSYNPSDAGGGGGGAGGSSVPGLVPSSSLSASSASYTYGGGGGGGGSRHQQPRPSSRGRPDGRPLYHQAPEQGSLSGLSRPGQYGTSRQRQGYGDDRSTYSAYSSRSQYSQPSAYSFPGQGGGGGGSVRGGYAQMYADHDAPSTSSTFGSLPSASYDQQRGFGYQRYPDQGGSRSDASGYSNAAGSASSAVDAMKLLLHSPPPAPPMQSSVLPPSSSSTTGGGAGSDWGVSALPPSRLDYGGGGEAPWRKDLAQHKVDEDKRKLEDQSTIQQQERSIALPASPPPVPHSFSGSATEEKPILPAHEDPEDSGSEFCWDEDDSGDSVFDEHDREFHRVAYGHASEIALPARTGRKKISPRTKKREWLLRMNRRLSEVPVGELDPAAVPISAIMNGWAKTKSSEGATMVEMWLRRSQEEYDAGNRRPGIAPTTKMFTMTVDAYAKSNEGSKAAQRAEELLQRMHEMHRSGRYENLKPTTGIFNAVINAWARSGDKMAPVRAEQILDWMEKLYKAGDRDVRPDKVSY